MHILKQIAAGVAAIAAAAVLVWLKFRQMRERTIFNDDKGSQELFESDRDSRN